MKKFILLRDNKESGPFTKKELKHFGLCFTDLIWIEGESTSWQFPLYIKGLEAIAEQGIKLPIPHRMVNRLPGNTESSKIPSIVGNPTSPLPESMQYSRQGNKRANRVSVIFANVSGVAVLFIGVVFCAFVVKEMFQSFDRPPAYSNAKAKEIQREVLPFSTVSHAAHQPSGGSQDFPGVASTFKKGFISRPAGIKKAIEKTENVNAEHGLALKDVSLTPGLLNSLASEAQVTGSEAADTKTDEENRMVTPAADDRPSLQITANDYKVGLFGGISNLELSVSNPSAQTVEKATVIVEFLKPNGSIIQSQTLQVENISPGSQRKISVPENSRGVKVRYRIG